MILQSKCKKIVYLSQYSKESRRTFFNNKHEKLNKNNIHVLQMRLRYNAELKI